mgnify:CR=1 FL=1
MFEKSYRKVGVVGSRSFTDYEYLCGVLDSLDLSVSDMIVSGGCKFGADALAERYAASRGLELKIFYADWQRYGRSAGVIRNRALVKFCDFVVLFWDGHSRGTGSTLRFCLEEKVPFLVVWKK